MAFLTLNILGCSSLNNRTIIAGATSFALCSVIAYKSAPQGEDEQMHGALYGGLCSTVSMAVSEVLKDNEKNKDIEKFKIANLKEERFEVDVRQQIISSKSIKSLDKSVQDSLKGKWDVYSKSEWIFDGKKLRHENMEIEFKE
jgi:hypothetical protein